MTQRIIWRFRLPHLPAFTKREDGSVTIFAIIAFSMLVVVVGLVIDVGRVMNVHSQANSYADRVALAAAAELDGRSNATNNALSRAIDAAQGVNRQVQPGFRLTLSGDSTIGVSKLTFMSALGPDNNDPFARSPLAGDVVTATWTPGGGGLQLAAGWTTTTAVRETSFVLVDTTQETENYLFFPLLGAFAPAMQTSATVAPQALAGFRREVCNYPPLMMCNIAEATQGPGASFSLVPGQMIQAKTQGGGASWGPGNYGLLDAPNGNGASFVRDYLGRVDPNTFCTEGNVDVRPGQATGPVSQGMNVRFDIYNGPMNKNDAQLVPAPNVTKGIRNKTGNGCGSNQSSTSTPLPRDNCFMPSGTWPSGIPTGAGAGCTTYNSIARAGDGNWNRSGYWSSNHPGVAQPAGYSTMTRYQVYRYEIEHPEMVNTGNNNTGESGAPRCYSGSTAPTTDPARDRRVIPIAIVNCLQHPISGNTDDVPVEEYAEAFITEPVGSGWWGATGEDIYLEIIGVVRPNLPTSTLREFPVLYR